MLYKSHPWHGISPGSKAPEEIICFIEVVPGDQMKYEIDKESGYLKVDRPNLYSSVVPLLYGFIPQSLSDDYSASLCMKETNRTGLIGDGDPLDVIILTDRTIPRGDIILEAIPIGGIRMIDQNETDDKIIAVLKSDQTYGSYQDIEDVPEKLLKRIRHYFSTYKEDPDQSLTTNEKVQLLETYNKASAHQVIAAAFQDYQLKFKKS